MKYPETTAIGDAGEFFFAYQIASVLGWPCRLFDIDIGIDAQVEILDKKRNSTGMFAAFQIKTTSLEKNDICRYVTKRQVTYWKRLELPVFIVLVDLTKQSMFFHRITDRIYPTTDKGKVRIEFDPSERFGKSSGEVIAAAAGEAAMEAINKHLAPVQEATADIQEALLEEPNPSPEKLIDLMNERHAAAKSLAQAEALAITLHTGATECSKVAAEFAAALEAMGAFMNEHEMYPTWDDASFGNGEIRKFLDELR